MIINIQQCLFPDVQFMIIYLYFQNIVDIQNISKIKKSHEGLKHYVAKSSKKTNMAKNIHKAAIYELLDRLS